MNSEQQNTLIVDRSVQSPNCGPRRDGLTPHLIVLHFTAMHSACAARDRLCDPTAEVSAHYLISRQGHLWNLVPEEQRAWHAGAGEWRGQDDINSRSIGIELDNDGSSPFAEPLMTTLERLLPGIMARWEMSPDGVIGHSDMAPGRKVDPGPRFDWTRLERQGLCARPELPTTRTDDDFVTKARAAGYTADVDPKTLHAAIMLRHRP